MSCAPIAIAWAASLASTWLLYRMTGTWGRVPGPPRKRAKPSSSLMFRSVNSANTSYRIDGSRLVCCIRTRQTKRPWLLSQGLSFFAVWLRGKDLSLRPLGYEGNVPWNSAPIIPLNAYSRRLTYHCLLCWIGACRSWFTYRTRTAMQGGKAHQPCDGSRSSPPRGPYPCATSRPHSVAPTDPRRGRDGLKDRS